MKRATIKIIIYIFRAIISFIYSFFKLLPVKDNKLVFCSRQSSNIPLDFMLIQKELERKIINIECVNICCHIRSTHNFDYIKFSIALLRSMYHLATSKVCILDSYWPAVSLLKHKKELNVIQIWHAIGKIKKSGYQSLGKKSGRKEEYARLLNMHKNYDYIVAGASIWNKFYCEAFGAPESKLLNYGLPRIDYLICNEEKNRKNFYSRYPELENKKIILYAPTFRRNMRSRWEEILEEMKDDSEYVLIIKKHPGDLYDKKISADNVYYVNDFNTIDLIAAADYFITDYSAGALEAAILRKRTYYWIYDYEDYISNNGLNIDIQKEMRPYAFCNIKELMADIRLGEYDDGFIDRYREKYLPKELGSATEKITGFVMDKIAEKA